jgi:hypothetical protein
MMKDLIGKLTKIEASAPKTSGKKMLNEDSTTPPMNVSDKPASLRDIFETLSVGQKPMPVVGKQGDTAHTGAGFLNVTDTSPAAQALQKAIGDLAASGKAQIVVPSQTQAGQPAQTAQTGTTGQPAQAGATGQPQVGQMQMKEKDEGKPGKNFAKIAKSAGERYGSKEAGERVAGAVRAKLAKQGKLEEESMEESGLQAYLGNKKYGKEGMNALRKAGREGASKEKMAQIRAKHDKMDEGAKVDRMVKHVEKSERKLGKSKDEAEDIAWATANKRGMLDNKNKKKVKEGDIPSTQGVDTMGAGLGAGRSATTLEGKKPDFLDLDKDGNKKEPMKKAAADKKKQKVKESMNHRISAARLEGKSHGLRGHAHSGKRYEDLDEIRAYHEGYKEGLDECYGQGVYETAPAMPAATVPGMASAAMPTMEDDMEEGNAFTAALAKTPKGEKFSVGGKTFTDRTNYNAKVDEYAFESWDNQLNDLLNEGLSVSVSKGQQNSPDSVTITAQDAEADQLLQLVKSAGLGLFGGDEGHEAHPSSAMSIQPSHGAADEVGAGGAEIDVVDDSDGMLAIMKKLGGVEAAGANDYEDEKGATDCGCTGDCDCNEKTNEVNDMCAECGGMMEANHSCGSKEMVDEVESEDQMEFEVAEDNAPDSETAEHNADEEAEAEEDSALARAAQQNKTTTVNEDGDEASEEGPESKEGETDEEGETVSESFANLFRKLAFIAEESTEKEDDKAEKAGKKVAKDIEHDEGHKGKDDDKAEKAGKKVTKDIEYDDKKDKKEKVDEWANNAGPGKTVSDTTFEQDIDFMTKVIAGGLNKPKSTGQTTVPVIAGQNDRMHDNPMDWATLAGIKK